MKRVKTSQDSPCNVCGVKPKHGRHGKCKECRNASERERYANTPFETRSQKQLDRYYRNHENRKAVNRRVVRAWRDKNPDKVKAQNLKFRRDNPGYATRWTRDNPSKAKAIWDNRRARKRNAEGYYTERDWLDIVYRQQSCCMSCGLFCNLTVDHITPLSRSGTNWPSNLQGLCHSCNSSKCDKLDYEFVIPRNLF